MLWMHPLTCWLCFIMRVLGCKSLHRTISFSSHLEKHPVGIFIVSYSGFVSAIQSYVNINHPQRTSSQHVVAYSFFPTTAFFSYMPSNAPFIIFGIANMVLTIVSLFGLLALYLASVLLHSNGIHNKG